MRNLESLRMGGQKRCSELPGRVKRAIALNAVGTRGARSQSDKIVKRQGLRLGFGQDPDDQKLSQSQENLDYCLQGRKA